MICILDGDYLALFLTNRERSHFDRREKWGKVRSVVITMMAGAWCQKGAVADDKEFGCRFYLFRLSNHRFRKDS